MTAPELYEGYMNRNHKIISIALTMLVLSGIPSVNGQVAIDLAINPSGYTVENSVYAYSQYVSYMSNIGASPADSTLVHDPIEVAELAFQKGDVQVFIEVFRYASTDEAVEEYEAQKNDKDGTSKLYNGPMFQRFISRDRIFQHENFIALASFEPYNSMDAYDAVKEVFEAFIVNAVETVGGSTPAMPSANGDSAVWGIEVGDIISWNVDDDTFAGTITTGGSSSSANWVPEIEIVEISDSGHAVLIKEQKAVTEYWYEDEARATLDIPYEGLSWRLIHNNGMTITDSNDKQTMPLIYPLELNGVTLTDLVDETIDNLPEKSYTDGADYYGVFGKTRSGSGYTPVETQWLDISVHRGTGIVSSYDWYYNNNDYGITATSKISVGTTNINYATRVSEPTIKTFAGAIYVEPNPVEAGVPMVVELDLYDNDGASVTGATVSVRLSGMEYAMTDNGDGTYSKSVETDSMDAGDYTWSIYVEKTGFEATTGEFTFTIEAGTQPDPPTDPDSSPFSIPGMPISAILVGVSLLVASRRKD